MDKADPPYPRSTSVWWFDCKSQSSNSGELTKASLNGDDQKPIYVGDPDNSTDVPSNVRFQDDYVDTDGVDGSEKQDVDSQQDDDNMVTAAPNKQALDGNSAESSRSSLLLTLLIAAVFQVFQRRRVLWIWRTYLGTMVYSNLYFILSCWMIMMEFWAYFFINISVPCWNQDVLWGLVAFTHFGVFECLLFANDGNYFWWYAVLQIPLCHI